MNRAVPAAILGVAFALTAGPAVAAPVRMTHKVTISGEFVNHWTVEEDEDCGPIGDGTLTVKFHTRGATRVLPYRDNDAGRKWNVAIPFGDNLRAMQDAKVTGTITRVDNTTPRPIPDDPEPCPAPTRSGCGTFPLGKSSAVVHGFDDRRISAHLSSGFYPRRECLIGDASSWGGPQRLVGGNREGDLLVKMPKPSAFKRRRVVRISASTHKLSSYSDPGSDSSTNDITRKVTVTFTRL